MNKAELRENMLNKRKKITHKKEKSTIIVEKIKRLDIYKNAKTIAMYNSLPDEATLNELMIDAKKTKKHLLLPRILNDKLVFIEINDMTKYVKSKLGVLEPANKNYWNKKIDLILVPGVAFDKDNNRLGFGKGYYDQYLSKNTAYKIGICFDEQLINNLIVEEHDVKMDLVVTNKV